MGGHPPCADKCVVGYQINDWLIDWCFNGTSTQKGQFVPTAGEGKWSIISFAAGAYRMPVWLVDSRPWSRRRWVSSGSTRSLLALRCVKCFAPSSYTQDATVSVGDSVWIDSSRRNETSSRVYSNHECDIMNSLSRTVTYNAKKLQIQKLLCCNPGTFSLVLVLLLFYLKCKIFRTCDFCDN